MHGEDQNKMAEQLVNSVKSMVDPNASLEQQLTQMRAQLAALAQLPCVIQQSLEILSKQLSTMSQQESHKMSYEAQMNAQSQQQLQIQENTMEIQEYQVQEAQNSQELTQNYLTEEAAQNYEEGTQNGTVTIEEVQNEQRPTLTPAEFAALKREEETLIEEQNRTEKEKKEQLEKARFEQESRQIKQRAPRVAKPKRVFGPPEDQVRPVVLPGGRRWNGPKDAFNEEMIKETITAQSEMIQGKVMGINFMKYEKPPVNLDHLQNSATYKLIHNMEQTPAKRVDMLTPVIAEQDYRERCRSMTPVQMPTNGM